MKHAIFLSIICCSLVFGLEAMSEVPTTARKKSVAWADQVKVAQVETKKKHDARIVEHAALGNLRFVQCLLEDGVDINSRAESGATALHAVVYNGNERMLNFLLKQEPDINVQDKQGVTPLMLAANKGHVACVKKLITAGARLDCRDAKGRSLLLLALQSPDVKVVEDVVDLLLKAGLDAKQQNGTAELALCLAAVFGYTKIVTWLLDAGIPVNQIDKDGNSALSFAVQEGHVDTVKLLLERGADTSFIREWKEKNLRETAVDIAMRREKVEENAGKRGRYQAIIKLLRLMGALTVQEIEQASRDSCCIVS